MAGALYAEVDEGTHQLVLISNRRIRALELLMESEAVEQCFQEVSARCLVGLSDGCLRAVRALLNLGE